MREIDAVVALRPLIERHPFAVAAMIGLGFVEALLEGVGIGLFIPLLYSMQGDAFEIGTSDPLGRALEAVFATVPADHRVLTIALCIFGIVVFKNVLSFGSGVLFSWVDARLFHWLRAQSLDAILDAGPAFVAQERAGVLFNTIEEETWTSVEAFSTLVGLTIILLTIGIFGGLLLLLSWPLTLLVVAALFSISAIIRWLTRRIKSMSREGVALEEALSHQMLELLQGLRSVTIFGRIAYEKDRFLSASSRIIKLYLRLDVTASLVHPVSEILVAALLLGVLLVAALKSIALPLALTFLLILYRLHPHIKSLDASRTDLVAAIPSIDRVTTLLDRARRARMPSGTRPFEALDGDIQFSGVTFRYPLAEVAALQNVTMRIQQGRTTAVVGPSGAGKSTLLDLLLRFYDPDAGAIHIGTTPLDQLDASTWRRRISVVGQDVHLFHASVRANIAYGRLDASPADVETAAKAAGAHDFICALPRGYDTAVGDLGVRLSAGQRQRIALARALIRRPDLFIFDEATSALDSITEDAILTALENVVQHQTVVVVTHRLTSVERADCIVVLDEGHVVEQGSFLDLIQNRGLFAEMYALHSTSSEIPTSSLPLSEPV